VGHRKNKGGNKKVAGFDENENTAYQNLWETAKIVLTGKILARVHILKITERSQINNLMLHLKLLKKQNMLNQ
jgi:hypothetical protein